MISPPGEAKAWRVTVAALKAVADTGVGVVYDLDGVDDGAGDDYDGVAGVDAVRAVDAVDLCVWGDHCSKTAVHHHETCDPEMTREHG